jgi:preprotein translocase subunit YajC
MTFLYGLLAAHSGVFAATTTKAGGFQTYGLWILIGVMLVVFYVLLIRPQRKRAQEHDDMVSKLRKGEEVITIGGIHGIIRKVTDDSVVIEVDKGVRVTFTKSAIARRLTPPEEEEEEEEAVEPADEAEEETAETEEETEEEDEDEDEEE